jgi:hypothetical protein
MSMLGGIADIIGEAGNFTRDLRIAITGKADEATMLEFALKAQALETSLYKAQAETNRAEAKSKSLFVAGWRPAVGWLCIIIIALHFIVFPFVIWGCMLCGVNVELPLLDIGYILTIVLGMLGIGGLRSIDKHNGNVTDSLSNYKGSEGGKYHEKY